MSRYIKVSAVGGRRCQVPAGASDENAVDLVMHKLERDLEKVLPDNPDLVLLTEVAVKPAGYSLAKNKNYLEKIKKPFTDFLKNKAKQYRTNIIYGGFLTEAGKTYNIQQLIDRNGQEAGNYKKCFPVIGEIDGGITPGSEQGLIKTDVGTIAGVICFDLNYYPILFHTASLRPDMVVFSSMYHGGFMQQVWAYFCRAHFIGASDDEPCTIINPAGVKIASSTNYLNTVTGIINLDGALFHVDFNVIGENRYREAKKYYGPGLKISDPGQLGVVYISSESDEFTINDVIERFKFEKLDDYFRRSIDKSTQARGREFTVKLHDQI